MKHRVLCGADRLDYAKNLLSGKRLGLITAPTGVNRAMDATIDLLRKNFRLTALFACEHGVRGNAQAGDKVEDGIDPETGVPVFSLYGTSRHITAQMGAHFDTLVYDIQDVGARFYTYLYTLSYAMQDCAALGKPLIVLDRINPLGGTLVEGTLLDEAFHSFVGEYAMPTRFGLTVGEYAHFVRDHLQLDVELHVIPIEGWKREMDWLDTELCFIPPSPNIPTPQTALLYIGTCVFEGTNVSEGRGTTTPFEWIGAPWIDSARLQTHMRAHQLPGVLIRRASFTPTFSKHAGEVCHGVQLHVTDRHTFESFRTGLLLLAAVRELHPSEFEWRIWNDEAAGARYPIDRLLGTDALRTGKLSAPELIEAHRPLVAQFQEQSRKYYLYD